MSPPPRVLESTAVLLDAQVAKAQVAGMVPSMVAALIRHGDVVWTGSRGRAVRRGSDERPHRDTQYRIGSITKTITAALVMQLRDEGRLDLADPLSRHVPDAPFGDRTLRSLLAHTAGVPAEPPGDWWERSPGRAWADLRAAVETARAVLPAGRQYHYSNVSYALLGQLVSRLLGRSWADAVQTRVLGPLEMTRTSYHPEEPAAQGFSVHPYAGTLTDEPAQDTLAMAPAGQLWSTLGDLGAWLTFLADPDSAVLAPETIEEMAIVQSGDLRDGYGLGLRLLAHDEAVLVGHTGSMPGFLAAGFIDRATKVGAVVLANATAGLNVTGLVRDLVGTVLDREPPLPTEWAPTAEAGAPGELLGPWYWGNTPFTLSLRDGGLVLDTPARQQPTRFRPVEGDAYVGLDGYFTGETLRVVRRPEGDISHLDVATFVLTRTPYDPAAPIPGGPPEAPPA